MSNEILVENTFLPWDEIWSKSLHAYIDAPIQSLDHHITFIFDQSCCGTYDLDLIMNKVIEKYAMIGVNLIVDGIYYITDSIVEYSNDIGEFYQNFRRKSSVVANLLQYPSYVGTVVYCCNRPEFERAAGRHYRYGGGMNVVLCNLGTRTQFQPEDGYRIVLVSHEAGHVHGAGHDSTVYDGGIKTIMHSPLFTNEYDRLFFSSKSGREIFGYIAAHEAYFNGFKHRLTINGGIAWPTLVGVTENYRFRYEGEGNLTDILVAYHPYKSVDEISLISYLKEHGATLTFESDGYLLEDWYQRSNPGIYGYIGIVTLPDGSKTNTNPVYAYLAGDWS